MNHRYQIYTRSIVSASLAAALLGFQAPSALAQNRNDKGSQHQGSTQRTASSAQNRGSSSQHQGSTQRTVKSVQTRGGSGQHRGSGQRTVSSVPIRGGSGGGQQRGWSQAPGGPAHVHRHHAPYVYNGYQYTWSGGQQWVVNPSNGQRRRVLDAFDFSGYPTSDYVCYIYDGHPWVKNRHTGVRTILNFNINLSF